MWKRYFLTEKETNGKDTDMYKARIQIEYVPFHLKNIRFKFLVIRRLLSKKWSVLLVYKFPQKILIRGNLRKT